MLQYQIEKRYDRINERTIYIPQPAPGNPVGLDRLAQDISEQCTVSKADCLAVLEALQDNIATHIAQGNPVRLGILGSFRPKMTAIPAEDPRDVTADNVKAIGVQFRATNQFKARLRKATIAQSPKTARQRKEK